MHSLVTSSFTSLSYLNLCSCECPPGFRGRTCSEREYCHWATCPGGAECRSLADGRECVANATFEGRDSSIVYRPEVGREVDEEANNLVELQFRTRRGGTVVQIVGGSGRHVRAAVASDGSGSARLEVPEAGDVTRSYEFGSGLDDGLWHTIMIRFDPPGVAAVGVDGGAATELTLDADVGGSVGLAGFVDRGYIVVGAQVKY